MKPGDKVRVTPKPDKDGNVAQSWDGVIAEEHVKELCWIVLDEHGKRWDALATCLTPIN